jgi:glyoxylase-like metal-dependent hydrolase (beta-lactamase superfamily II)
MPMFDRRMLLRAGSAAVGAAALTPNVPALAHAPQAGKRAQPSFYRFKLGTMEITVISDGTLAFPAETLWLDRAEDARGLLTSTFQPSSPVGLQINTILVNTGDKLVLIDAGCGVDKFQKTTGGLIANLAAAGYAPGDIDTILFTHFHFDHLWGISDHENASRCCLPREPSFTHHVNQNWREPLRPYTFLRSRLGRSAKIFPLSHFSLPWDPLNRR